MGVITIKTSVIMVRPMNGFSIRQDSKSEFFCATDLIEAFNLDSQRKKRLQHYFDNDSTKRFMDALLKEEIEQDRNSGDTLPKIMFVRRGKNGGTFVHPYLFLDLAMWLSPEFKVTVIKWVYDNLVKLRIDAGDSYKEVSAALFRSVPNSLPQVYSNEAKMINKLVFGRPDGGQRNSATTEQLNLLKYLQKADIKLIEEGLDYFARYEKLKELRRFFLE